MSQRPGIASGPRSGDRTRRARAPALALALTAALAAAVLTATGGSDEGTGVTYDQQSRQLQFRVSAFDGGTVDSAELRGTPLVLNFYASWCALCDRELPDFQRVAERLRGRVQVLGVNPQSNDTDAAQAEMIRRSSVTYPTARDPQDELLRQFNTTGGLPTTVFVDGDGVVQKVHNGLLTEQLLMAEIASSLGVRD